MARPATQKEIAKLLKVHPSTVCLALKKDPRVLPATIAAVQKAVVKLGYVRDPMLGALAAYRNARRPRAFQGTLAWLVTTAKDFDWRAYRDYADYFDGARQRARELGYQLEVFDLHAYEENPQRLFGIFRARSIRGVIVCPQPKVDTVIDLRFEHLSAVTIGYTLKSPALHAVTANHYASVLEICERLRTTGYKRIGFIIPSAHYLRLNGTLLSAFLFAQTTMKARERIPPYADDFGSAAITPFRAWLRRYRPDALIAACYQAEVLVDRLKLKIPEEIGVAMIAVLDGFRQFSGIDENSIGIGRTTAEVLVSMIERSEMGMPANPQRTLIRGRWHDGTSLRPAAATRGTESEVAG